MVGWEKTTGQVSDKWVSSRCPFATKTADPLAGATTRKSRSNFAPNFSSLHLYVSTILIYCAPNSMIDNHLPYLPSTHLSFDAEKFSPRKSRLQILVKFFISLYVSSGTRSHSSTNLEHLNTTTNTIVIVASIYIIQTYIISNYTHYLYLQLQTS